MRVGKQSQGAGCDIPLSFRHSALLQPGGLQNHFSTAPSDRLLLNTKAFTSGASLERCCLATHPNSDLNKMMAAALSLRLWASGDVYCLVVPTQGTT